LLIERTQSGLARAKSQGKSLGRPRSLDATQIKNVEQRLAEGETIAALAREFGTSRQSIMRLRELAP
jgi:putative DNA-invertase from lambdoid prophage Rac